MKKIITILILCSLLTIPVLALGNDYTFSTTWYDAVLRNTFFSLNTSDGDVNESVGNLTSLYYVNIKNGSGLVGGIENPTPFVCYDYGSSGAPYITYLNFSSPVNISVKKGETLNFQYMLMAETGKLYYTYEIPFLSSLVLSDGTYILLGSENYTKGYFKTTELGSLTLNSSGTAVTGFTSNKTGEALLVSVSWTNNTGSDVVVSTISNDFSPASSFYLREFCYGFFAENKDSSELPAYVEENLIKINNQLSTHTEYFDYIKILLESIETYLSDISYGSSNATYYYDTMMYPEMIPESHTIKMEELDQAVSDAKAELEEMKAVLSTATVPTFEDISQSVPAEIQISIDDALSDADVTSILNKLFENSIIVTMLLSVVSVATIGYIFYGKR